MSEVFTNVTNQASTLGADGFPLVVGNGLTFIHCLDTTCSRWEQNTLAVPSDRPPSVAIDSAGNPLVVINDFHPTVVACLNASCSGQHPRRELDSTQGLSGKGVRPSSIAIGTDGFPLISYILADGSARVAHCASVDCLTGTPTLTDLNATQLGLTPQVDTSVAIGVDGLGLIAMGGNALTAVHCSNVDCTTSTVSIVCAPTTCIFPAAAKPVDSIAITIGADGLALIGGRSADLGGTQVPLLFRCTDTLCTTRVGSILEQGAGVNRGKYMWVTLGVNGHPLLTYRDTTNALLRAAYCLDFACTTFNVTTIDSANSEFSSVLTGADGLPFVVAGDSVTHRVYAIHCSNIFCVPYPRNR